jgi:hypothetical protein
MSKVTTNDESDLIRPPAANEKPTKHEIDDHHARATPSFALMAHP